MKIDTSSVKKWTILQVEGKLFKVVDMSHTHTGRGSATYSFKAKDIINGWNQTLTYKSWTTLEQVEVLTKNAVFLYSGWDTYTFMENDSSEMYDIPAEEIEDVIPYLKENLDCFVMVFEDRVIGVILPNVIEYTIASTVPGVKWDRAQAGKKPATMENGLEVMVPLHLEEGSVVRVNTVTGDLA
jgi:elongation factor P